MQKYRNATLRDRAYRMEPHPGLQVANALKLAFAALGAGSRMIPLGDNGAILRELAAKSARIAPRTDLASNTSPRGTGRERYEIRDGRRR